MAKSAANRARRAAARFGRKSSAGGVAFRRGSDGFDIAMVGRRTEPPIWALPKGTPQTGETREMTALREVTEETGLHVRLLAPLGDIEYWFADGGVRFHKTVTFFLMEATGGDITGHDGEYDLVRWIPARQAINMATYPGERDIIQRAYTLLHEVKEAGND